jgi:hypothetical protein
MLIPETNDMDKYLEMIDIIDFGHDLVKVAAERLKSEVSRKAGIFGKADISKPGGMSCGTSKSGASKYSASKPDISRSGVLECGIPKYVSLKNSYDNPACPVWFEQAYAKAVFEHVRDAFPHSFDLLRSGKPVSGISCKASDVLLYGHGICYAKSHLLAALLRIAGIPAGFCYQKLLFGDENPVLALHAVNAVYLFSLKKWIRLDTRGNSKGIVAQYSTDEEKLAFPVRPELGEEDGFIIYAEPSHNAVRALKKSKTLYDLMDNLPGAI